MPRAEDGAQLRQRWDAACERADREVRTAREAAVTAGEGWVADWLTTELAQLAALQAAVDGRRRRPGDGASGLFRDVPPDLQLPVYAACADALDEVVRLFENGLGTDWDWSRGFPADWPATVRDRVRARAVWHRT